MLATYEDARNSNDYDALRALYAADPVIAGHPLVTTNPPVADVDTILELEARRGTRYPDEVTRYVDVQDSGNKATFYSLFFSHDGQC